VTAPPAVVVHVAGAVAAPGVYELPAGARVADAIGAAGGPTDGADPNALNLAAPVLDGDRVAVPRIGEPADHGGGGQSHAGTTVASGPLDLNRATVDELDALPGVGPATAAAIVAHREANGPFATVDELEAVRGIGPAKLESIRPLVTV
jgi:competence protein ComEA